MKKWELLYLTDNNIFYKKNNKIYETNLEKGIIYNNKISNINKFIKIFESFMNSNNLNNSLFGSNLKIITEMNYNDTDITLLKELFLKFNYKRVVIDKIVKCFKLTKDNAYLNINDNYISITYLDEFKKIENIGIETKCFRNTTDLMKYINYITLDKELYLLGSGNIIETIFSSFEDKFKKKTYIYNNAKTYIISKFKG